MRNPPLPMDVCFPDGNYPADAPKYEINPDWSKATPESGRAATGYVLVDFGKKNMEQTFNNHPIIGNCTAKRFVRSNYCLSQFAKRKVFWEYFESMNSCTTFCGLYLVEWLCTDDMQAFDEPQDLLPIPHGLGK